MFWFFSLSVSHISFEFQFCLLFQKAYDSRLDQLLRSVKPNEFVSERTKFGPLLDETHFSESPELVKLQQEVRELEEKGKKLVTENKR